MCFMNTLVANIHESLLSWFKGKTMILIFLELHLVGGKKLNLCSVLNDLIFYSCLRGKQLTYSLN